MIGRLDTPRDSLARDGRRSRLASRLVCPELLASFVGLRAIGEGQPKALRLALTIGRNTIHLRTNERMRHS